MTSSYYNNQFWSEKYKARQTQWNIGYPSPSLAAYIDQLEQKDLRILIPGCGYAYEAEYLLQRGFTHITLLDISAELVSQLRQKFKDQSVQIIQGDFFQHAEQYDLILEQTFFSSLDPSQRKDYVDRLLNLLVPGGTMAGVLFNKTFEAGPPFGGSRKEYQELFELKLFIKTMELCYNSIEERRGSELFVILKNINW
ncbi:MAG: methyltransferase domain-containing protein [Williamsia sp.]|nr:methyltransferase domain-containing protein [Williamsia sp.]